LVSVHEWTALVFMIVIGIHVSLHWSYVKKMLGSSKEKKSLSCLSQTMNLRSRHPNSSSRGCDQTTSGRRVGKRQSNGHPAV
jgi:hypothetical protein